jgi:hypothetical protein
MAATTSDPEALDRRVEGGWVQRVRDDRAMADGIEQLFAGFFLIIFFLFICQIVVWWHARNILEQAAAEGARTAAAADVDCAAAEDPAMALAERMGGDWVGSLEVTCIDTGLTSTVSVSARTPAFFLPGSLAVSASASAPEEAP